ncbi:MAG: histidinol-phosphatase [Paracoccus sp. (in: a-proteobacteria)]|uniref:histidinol-phosphatase n=1 Tax=Paracoccus sp. TaxID=267 RepID=UPI0026DEFF4C|nr:histidinol-phosphatase [Paracoccus sp. (in: a-proteobacteria)]MDO5620401.1 histidinol-phosphatase [Paracoccus sp. (in: a-proteobacteria)]
MIRSFPAAEVASIRAAAHRLADAARVQTLARFRNDDLATDNKQAGGFDPVTEADRAAERAMRALLAELRPDDGILGEEYGEQPGRSGLRWVLDPVDGTRAFISGAPSWGVLIAVEDASGPVYGLIDQPYIGERFEGGFGHALLTGPHGTRPLATCARGLADATLMTTFPEVGTAAERAGFDRVRDRVRLTRYGLDCYAYALLAMGQIDLVIEAGLQPYDIAAPIAVIQAAGGIVTNWQGGPAHPGGQVVAAGSADLHAQALALLAG